MVVTTKGLPEPSSSYFTAVYICVSFLLLMLVALLFYVLCSRRYRLNWYEKTQLADVEEAQCEGLHPLTSPGSGSILSCATEPAVPPSKAGTWPKGINRIFRSQSSSKLDSPTYTEPNSPFWVPKTLKRQMSVCQSDGIGEGSGDDSIPGTPNTPLGIKVSPFALSSMGATEKGGAVSPLVKYVQPGIMQSATSGRPRVATMYAKLDHTKIDATLYQMEAAAVSPPESTCEDFRGSLQFSLKYNAEFSLLSVHLIQARDLVAREFSGTADPYAKVRILPEEKIWRQSSVHKKTLSPLFDENFVFDVLQEELPYRTLEIAIYDYDQYSRHECMGMVHLPLDRVDLGEEVALWKGISPCEKETVKPELGELMFSLGYLPSAERLTVVIMRARNLKAIDEIKKTSDPYVKVAVVQGGRRLKKKKTTTQRGTINPVFNEALTFNISNDMLKKVSLEFTVVNDNMLGPNEMLGHVLIGYDAKGDEGAHLRDMLATKSVLAMWHPLTAPESS